MIEMSVHEEIAEKFPGDPSTGGIDPSILYAAFDKARSRGMNEDEIYDVIRSDFP